MKPQVDKMCELNKWQVDKMVSEGNVKLMKRYIDEMAN
jgi:hypothetical protein